MKMIVCFSLINNFIPVQMMSIYKEQKKIRTARGSLKWTEDYNMPTFDEAGNIISEATGHRPLFDEVARRRKIPTLDESEKPS